MRWSGPVLIVFLTLTAIRAEAETVLAARVIRAQTIVTEADLVLAEGDMPGTYVTLQEAVGQEARVMIYPGRPILIEDLGPPAIIDRNQIVTLTYMSGTLQIRAEGRALARAGVGDRLRVMNLASRSTVTGTVRADGSVAVMPLF